MLRSSVSSGASLEEAVTILSTVPPASSSAWVKVCVAEQFVELPTGMVVASHVMSSLSLLSLSDRPVIVTLPVLVTR